MRIWPQKLQALWQHLTLPPDLSRDQKVANTRFLAIDLELTGLDLKQDHIVSMAWVPVHGLEIVLAQAQHHLINTSRGVGHSATIHGIHDHQVAGGQSLCTVLEQLLPWQQDHVLVAHHAALDLGFVRRAASHCGHTAPQWPVVDTLALEARRLRQQGQSLAPGALSLSRCLQRHHLPQGRQHDALADAFGCAQLLLSQLARLGRPGLRLGELLKLARPG